MYQIYFILEWHSVCFGRFFRPSSGVQDCTYSNRHLANRYCCLFASITSCSDGWTMFYVLPMLVHYVLCSASVGALMVHYVLCSASVGVLMVHYVLCSASVGALMVHYVLCSASVGALMVHYVLCSVSVGALKVHYVLCSASVGALKVHYYAGWSIYSTKHHLTSNTPLLFIQRAFNLTVSVNKQNLDIIITYLKQCRGHTFSLHDIIKAGECQAQFLSTVEAKLVWFIARQMRHSRPRFFCWGT